nr:hypothetical protein [Tanacetum cinerariifolium]
MAKSSLENELCCSKDCKKNNDSLNSKIKDLTGELSEANNYIYHYKLAVAQLEGRLVEYKEREVKYIEKIRTLEMYRASNLKSIKTLDKELETLTEEKDVVDGKLARLLKSSKDLESLIESQRSDKVKEGVGYNAVPPPATDLYLSPKKDLSWTGLPEFADDTVTDYSRSSPTIESTSEDGQNQNSSASKNGEPIDSILSKPAVKFVKAVDRPTERPTTNKAKTVKKPTVKYAEIPDGHRPHDPPMKPMRPNMNGARPNRTTFNKQAHSYANRSFQRTSTVRSQYRAPWVPTVNRNFPPVNRKLPTGNSNVSTMCCCCSRHVNTARPNAMINRRNRVKDVQATANWVWKSVKPNSASIILKRYDYVDVRGRSSQKDVKKQKLSEEAPESKTSTEEVGEDKIKEMMQLVPVEDVYVQALQVKHPIIDWKVHSEGERTYWQIIRLGGSTASYQFFVDLLRPLDKEDLNQLWALVKEYLTIKPASNDKEIELWV